MFFFFNNDANRAQEIYDLLMADFGFKGATGKISFKLNDFNITVDQNNIVGNILEEWLDKWMTSKGIPHVHNHRQSSPDFWLNPDDTENDWLEIKSFTGSPNFDIASYMSFINLIIEKPYKLHSNYLLIKYKMENGTIIIENCWLKKIWEICCTSERWSIKVQCKSNIINNIRPAVWYSDKKEYPTFESLEDFLSALEQTVYRYKGTNAIAETWLEKVISSYKRFYGIELKISRWMDIKHKYIHDGHKGIRPRNE
ncbi:NgoBV family restriction endonuclease [uncultured Muribaculum sp.]|uniref:NgoBV family restriction endonuclease n=1 Tax=uncultured Muribaculum sp. TaxID=1918613 RepID=UPI0025FF7C35|nr:NgoBV family restriction endonuclease [uncultured Muribaculum sp.]